jgi:hypothetical protein
MREASSPLTRLIDPLLRGIAAAALCSLLALPQLEAQARLSEKGLVAQTVGTTTITVEYYRPVARGRANIFPNVVHWDERWTPGANWAATIDVDQDVKVEGQLLPKGKYSIWTIVRPDTWTVDFHRSTRRFHLNRPDSSDRQLRVTARVDSSANTEVLTYDFPDVGTGTTTLRLRWGALAIPLHLTMFAPPLEMVAKADRARFVGRYDVEVFSLQPGQPNQHRLIEIAEVSDTLHWRDVENRGQPLRDFILSPSGPDNELTRARLGPDGQWWSEAGVTIAFTIEGGRSTGFEVQILDSMPASRAKRVR